MDARDAGDERWIRAKASSRLVHGPSATIVGGCGLPTMARANRSVAASGVVDCGWGGISMPHPVSAAVRHSAGNGSPSGPGSVRPHAYGTDDAPSWSSTYCATARPLAQVVTPVPVGAIVSARTSRLGSSSSAATAATSLTSKSVSMMIGLGPAGGSLVPVGGSLGSGLPPHEVTIRHAIARDTIRPHVAVIGGMVGSVATRMRRELRSPRPHSRASWR